MMAKHWLRSGGAALTLSVMAIACGGKPAVKGPTAKVEPTKTPAPPEAREVHERITAHMCPARTKLAELLGHTTTPPAPPAEETRCV